MVEKKLQKYCRIYQWIEAHDKALAEAIRDLCMEGALSPKRKTGITFIYPTTSQRKQIIKDTYSSDPIKAIQQLDAHILRTALVPGCDFQKIISCRLGIIIKIKNHTDTEIILENGAKIVIAEDFIPLQKDNIAVWLLESGEMPTEGEEIDQKIVHGRGEITDPQPVRHKSSARAILATTVEQSYNDCMRTDHCRSFDPYLSHVVSLLNFLKLHHKTVLNSILPLIDRDPIVTFYLLLEPYKTTNDHLLGDVLLFGAKGWNGAQIYEGAVEEFYQYFNDLGDATEESATDRAGHKTIPLIFSNVGMVRRNIDITRIALLGHEGDRVNKIATPQAVRTFYEILSSTNTIADAHCVFPDDTLRQVPKLKKLWQDELRFVLHAALQELRHRPYSKETYETILKMLRFDRRGDDYARESSLTDALRLHNNIAPQAEFELMLRFINSSDYLYIPVTREHITSHWGDVPVTDASQFYNPNSRLNIINTEISKDKLYDSYSPVTSNGLPLGCISAVQHYINIHGKLPPDLKLNE